MMVETTASSLQLLLKAAETSEIVDIADALYTITGRTVVIESTDGTVLARASSDRTSTSRLPPGDASAALRAEARRPITHRNIEIAALRIDAAEHGGTACAPLVLDLAARLIGEQIAHGLAREEGRRRLAATVLADVIGGYTTERESLHRLAGLNIDVARPFRVVVARSRSETAAFAEGALGRLHVDLAGLPTSAPVIPLEGDLVVIAREQKRESASGGLSPQELGELVLGRFGEALDSTTAGVSHAHTGTAGLRIAYHEAVSAAARGSGIRHAELIDLPLSLVSSRTAVPTRELAEAALAPLLAYDARTGGQLVETLRGYLDAGRNTVQTAKQMYLHRSTVRYRLAKIEELLSASLEDSRVIATLWLALVALEHSPDAVGAND